MGRRTSEAVENGWKVLRLGGRRPKEEIDSSLIWPQIAVVSIAALGSERRSGGRAGTTPAAPIGRMFPTGWRLFISLQPTQ